MNEIIPIVLLVILVLEVSYLVYINQRSNVRGKNTAMYVDTSVLMDGRILAIAKTGFITADLVIPRSVVGELQLLADGGDSEKRSRARYGLDIAQKLKSCDLVNVRILQDGNMAREGVDNRLLSLVKKYGGVICTIDYNLNKVAQVEGIGVVNVNELAKNVRFMRLPGETMRLELVQKGQDSHQGVGYLDDGTMVVVENASKYVGRVVDIEFVRAIQTDAGRMMFAKLIAVATNKVVNKNTGKKRDDSKKLTEPAKVSGAVNRVAKVVKSKSSKSRIKSASDNPKDTNTASSKKQKSTKTATRRAGTAKASSQRGPSNRQTNEDRLIDLVEKQS